MKRPGLILLFQAGMAMVLMASALPPAIQAQSASDSDSVACAERIYDNCKRYIYTVSAMVQNNENGENGNWQKNIGTAVAVSSSGHLVTANSVVKDAKDIRITGHDGNTYSAELVGCDVTGRVAVLKIGGNFSGAIPSFSNLSEIETGSRVFSLGVVPGMKVDVSCGKIKHVHYNDGAIEIVSSKFPGTSGTPVFDTDENLIGIIAYKVEQGSGDSDPQAPSSYIALSYDYAAVLARRVIDGNVPKCGWLGICIDMANSNNGGIYIKDIIKGSPADQARILPDDIIYEYNGTPASSISTFSEAFTKTKAGDRVTIKLLRGSSHLSVDVKLEER